MANFRDFALKVIELEKEINNLPPQQGTKEWILKSKLSLLVQKCNSADRATDVTTMVQALMRFTVDSLDFDSQYAKQIAELASYHDSLVKSEIVNTS